MAAFIGKTARLHGLGGRTLFIPPHNRKVMP